MTNAQACEVLLLPHLPLAEPARIGPWLLGPVNAHRWSSEDIRSATEQLLARHDATADPSAVVSLAGEEVGNPARYDLDAVMTLQRALTLSGLDGNPDVQDRGWAAYRAVSADNLTIEGWTLDLDEGYFATCRGQLIQEIRGGLQLDDTDSRVPVPVEIRHPEPITLDCELANAVLEYLTLAGSKASEPHWERMGSAIDWLTLAWRNSASVGFAPRVVFLRTAFEALFPGKAHETAAALRDHFERFGAQADIALDRTTSELLWSPTESPVHEPNNRSDPLNTDLQEWFRVFNLTRNRIVHRGETSPATYDGPAMRYRGDFFWTGERIIREVIRTELSIAGYGDVWMRPDSRSLHRAAVEAIEKLERSANEAESPGAESGNRKP